MCVSCLVVRDDRSRLPRRPVTTDLVSLEEASKRTLVE